MGLPDKRLAIENHSNDELINYGLAGINYPTVKTVNLKVSINPNDRTFRLCARIYHLPHSNNLMGIDFKLVSPNDEYCIITAGSMSKSSIRWTDLALSLTPIFWANEHGDYSMILTDQLGDTLKNLIPNLRRNTLAIPTSNKEKSSKSRNSRQLQKIIRSGIKR